MLLNVVSSLTYFSYIVYPQLQVPMPMSCMSDRVIVDSRRFGFGAMVCMRLNTKLQPLYMLLLLTLVIYC